MQRLRYGIYEASRVEEYIRDTVEADPAHNYIDVEDNSSVKLDRFISQAVVYIEIDQRARQNLPSLRRIYDQSTDNYCDFFLKGLKELARHGNKNFVNFYYRVLKFSTIPGTQLLVKVKINHANGVLEKFFRSGKGK